MKHLTRLAFTAAITLGLIACNTVTSSSWDGSVDAVFRYRDNDQSLIVYKVAKDSFSREAGLRPGDRIISIDGQSLEGLSFEETRELFRGPVGTVCTLEVQRDGEIVQIEVERRKRKAD